LTLPIPHEIRLKNAKNIAISQTGQRGPEPPFLKPIPALHLVQMREKLWHRKQLSKRTKCDVNNIIFLLVNALIKAFFTSRIRAKAQHMHCTGVVVG